MAQTLHHAPADCGRRLIPQLVDEIAHHDPDRSFISVPKSSNISDGYKDVDYKDFSRAVNRCAWLLEKELGHDRETQTLFYMGSLDLRYLIVLLAAVKIGHRAFFSSHRNSLEAHLSLLNASNCNIILLPNQAPVIVNQILAAKPMEVISFPEVEFFMSEGEDTKVYPYQYSFEDTKDKTMVILHTSGSTGIPKPVFVTHGTFACNDAHQLIPSLGGNPTTVHYMQGKRLFLAFPLFHAANLTFTIGYGIFAGITCVLPPPGPLTADIVNAVHTSGNVAGSLLPPSILSDIYKDSDYFNNMSERLEFVAYVGGTLAKEIGDPVSARLKLITLMGSTETMLLPIELNQNPADWQYLPVSAFLGHEFRLSRDGLRELVIVRNKELEIFQGVFSTFPALEEYPMSDLYEQHPTETTSWVFRARADDIISFNNAEKLNPVTMEAIISSHPAISSAIIGGHGEFQAALLVEPKVCPSTAEEEAILLTEIWPIIVRANRDCPAHGRIMKEFIMFTKPDKPMPRAGKDTVQRFAALKLYQEEFKSLYAFQSHHSSSENSSKPGSPPSYSQQMRVPSDSVTAMHDNSIHEKLHNIASNQIPSEFDQRLEAALCRVLPNILPEYIQSSLAQLINSILQPKAVPNIATDDSYVKPSANGRIPDSCHSLKNGTRQSTTDTLDDLKQSLYSIITSNSYLHDLSFTADLFQSGLDSLQLPVLVKEINAFLVKSNLGIGLITTKTIYENRSIEMLATMMKSSSN